jgi:hypothetical protein
LIIDLHSCSFVQFVSRFRVENLSGFMRLYANTPNDSWWFYPVFSRLAMTASGSRRILRDRNWQFLPVPTQPEPRNTPPPARTSAPRIP